MAVSGHNVNNETQIGMSSSIGLSIYDSETNNEIEIIQSKSPIDIIMPRDKSVLSYSHQFVNATNLEFHNGSFYLQNNLNITSNNASIHIELMPLNLSIGYLLVFKMGYMPIINSTYADYTTFKIICPSKAIVFISIIIFFII